MLRIMIVRLAASEGHAAVVNPLPKNNADVNPADRDGDNSIEQAT